MRMRVSPTKKQSRQDLMLRLVKENKMTTQDELKEALERYGFEVTQSSLSRDIKELGLVKQQGVYVVPPRGMHGSTPPITTMESAGPNMIVLKTLVGMAAPVGITLDSQKIQGVVGTVAGDDTVFLATSPSFSHDIIKKQIRKLFKGE